MKTPLSMILSFALVACGAGKPANTGTAGDAPPVSMGAIVTEDDPIPEERASDTPPEAPEDNAPPPAPEPPPEGPLKASATESLLKITIIDNKGTPIPGVMVTVENPAGRKFVSRESDEKGFLELLVPKGDTYTVRFVSLQEDAYETTVPMPDKPNITAEFELTHTPATTRSFVLKGVFFDTAKWTLRPESYPNLENLLEFMTVKKSAVIRLEGHTDNVGDDRANQVLSQKRAGAVRQYLIRKGISGARIKAVGYGESQPIATNDTEAGRQTNRRTVVTILDE